jgi:small subunit ribosomal protein S21
LIFKFAFVDLQSDFINNIKMIIIPIKDNEAIDRVLKKFKKKFERTGVVRELRDRQAFEKPSVTRRTEVLKAVYIQDLRRQEGTL